MVKSNQINDKKYEEYHQYSEMLSAIFEFSPDAISLTRVSDGEIIDCNPEYLNQIGYSREEVIGHTSLELNLINLNERQEFVNKIQRKQVINNLELKIKRKDNVFINVLYSTRFITVNGIQTILSIGKDITKRKKVEQQLEYNADMMDQLYDAVIRTDTNFIINYWNKAAEKMFGYPQDEALGINSAELLRPIYAPNERDKKSEELKKKGILKTITKIKHKNGNYIIVEQNATQINDNSGVTIGYSVIYHDITENKKAEALNQKLLKKEKELAEELTVSNEELQSATEELHQHMNYLTDLNKKLKLSEEMFFKAFQFNPAPMSFGDGNKWIDVNESFSKLTGYRKEELVGHTPAELNLINTKKSKQYVTETIEKGSIADVELELLTKSGEKRIVISSMEIIEIDNEKRFINFIQDITKRKERELLNNALDNVNSYINSTLDYNEIMQLIVDLGSKTLNVESSVVNMHVEGNWIVKYIYNFPNNIIGQIKSDLESPTSMYVLNKREAVAFDDAKNDPRVNKNGMKMHGVASVLVVPIILKDKVEGVIAYYHHKKRVVFSKEQIDFANKLASSLSQSLENAKLFEAIKKSEDLYRTLFDSMTEGFAIDEIILDHKGKPYDLRYLAVNNAFERQTGLKGDDIIGKTTLELFPDSESVWFERYGNVVLTGQSAHFVERFGPLEKWFDVYAFKTGGYQFGVIFTDITDKKKAEEDLKRHAALLDVSNEAIFSFDMKEGILSWNQGAEKLYGYNYKDAKGKISHDLLKTKFPLEFNEYKKNLLNDKKWSGELIHQTKDDKEIIVESHQQLIHDDTGKNIIIETNRDITERKANEEKMKSTMEELRRSNKELEQFAYVSSHDLQEPLRMVTLYSQLLERRYKDRLDDDADDFIEYIIEGALRMKQLIDDLLAYSRVTSHAKKLENVNLEKLLKAVLSNLLVPIEENNAKITHNPLPTVFADSSQMLQVFQNLINNAIKFRRQTPPKIHISSQKGKNEWTISITDNGIGINSEHQKQIFDVFKRLHTRDKYPGSGIGLSICQKIIERHGGKIWVESKPGQGSRFYFTIPIKTKIPIF